MGGCRREGGHPRATAGQGQRKSSTDAPLRQSFEALQRTLEMTREDLGPVVVVAAPVRRLFGAQHLRICNPESHRRDTEAVEQLPQFIGCRTHDPAKVPRRQMDAQQRHQEDAAPRPQRRQMADFDHMGAFEGRLMPRKHGLDGPNEIPLKEQRRLGRDAEASGSRDVTASITQAHQARSEVPDLRVKARLEDGPDEGFDILASFILWRMDAQRGERDRSRV